VHYKKLFEHSKLTTSATKMSQKMQDTMQTIPPEIFMLRGDGKFDILKTVQYCIQIACTTKLEDLQAIARNLHDRGISNLKFSQQGKEDLLITIMRESLCNYNKHSIRDLSLAPLLETQPVQNLHEIAYFLRKWAEDCRKDMRSDKLLQDLTGNLDQNVPSMVQKILAWLLELTGQYFTTKPASDKIFKQRMNRGLVINSGNNSNDIAGPPDHTDDGKKIKQKRKRRRIDEDDDLEQTSNLNDSTLSQPSVPTQAPPQMGPVPTVHNVPTVPVNNAPPVKDLSALLEMLHKEEKVMTEKFLFDMLNSHDERRKMYFGSDLTVEKVRHLEAKYDSYLKEKRVAYFATMSQNCDSQIELLQNLLLEAQQKKQSHQTNLLQLQQQRNM
jgi:hypothetical protein